ncbi:MAG: DUF494 family protein [Wenzhouxiangellaceae bacterium]
MKENVLQVLMYLFENYIYDEPDTTPDRASLEGTLEEAGFTTGEIDKAFRWLDELAQRRDDTVIALCPQRPLRLYSAEELTRIDTECRSFLLHLENLGVLDPACRELVIDRLMALDLDEVELEDVKWVVLMVLFSQPGQEANYAWMEDLVFDEIPEARH